MPPDPAVEIAEGGRAFVPADDKPRSLWGAKTLFRAWDGTDLQAELSADAPHG
jgi:hypothetical protein